MSDYNGEHILLLIREAAQRIARDAETVAPRGLGFVAQVLLFEILGQDGMRTIDLARTLGMAKSNVKAHLNRLETGGLIRREWVSRREVRLRLTRKGRETIVEIAEELRQLAELYWGDQPREDLEAVLRILVKIRERSQ